MAEKKKRRDWTKVDVEDIKKNLPKILLFFVIILPLLHIGYLSWINTQNTNTPNVNSGVTIDTKTYGVHIENKTSAVNKTWTVSDTDFSNTTDLINLVKAVIGWFPILFALFLLLKIFSWFSKD